jgi:hypothetical protein
MAIATAIVLALPDLDPFALYGHRVALTGA